MNAEQRKADMKKSACTEILFYLEVDYRYVYSLTEKEGVWQHFVGNRRWAECKEPTFIENFEIFNEEVGPKLASIIAAHDKQPSGESKEYELRLINTMNRAHKEKQDKEIKELKRKVALQREAINVLNINALAARDPGKVEALIEKAEILIKSLRESKLNLYIHIFAHIQALEDAIKGVSDGK